MNSLINLGLTTKEEKVLVSSRIIAEKFDKEHFNVVRDIENLLKSEPLKNEGLKYFIDSMYKHRGNEYKEYLLTRDGFSILVMGFNGKKALDWKVKYIEAFNSMESFIRERISSEWQETRIKGKLARRNETDVIMNKLIPLALLQGSKNAGKLYMTYSKLVNSCVGIPSNSREKATQRTLDVIFNLENLIENVIAQEVNKGTYYKDIYQICKGKCNLMIELMYLPERKLIS
jgi:Rha family phage regulatory protein